MKRHLNTPRSGTINSNLRLHRQVQLHGLCTLACAACCSAALSPVQAAALPFAATVEGTSTIVEVLNPVGPVVRVPTLATGDGTAEPLVSHSGDLIDLATGQGQGSNRFVWSTGDELLGHFSVQMVPGADASLFDLIGDVVFQGGTGIFQGARGGAAFRGSGQFFSASQAHTRFEFQGTLNTVAAPSTLWLAALAALVGLKGLARATLVGPCRRPVQARFNQASASFTQ